VAAGRPRSYIGVLLLPIYHHVMVDEPLPSVARRGGIGVLGQWLVASPALAPATVAVAVFVGWAGYQAGYPPTVWYPGGLLLGAALATALAIGQWPLAGVPRPTLGAVGFLSGFTAWSYLSILWAEQQGDAWDGANRTLVYLGVFALFALRPWRPGAAAVLMGGYAVGVAAILVAYLARAASGDPGDFLIGGRFAEPAGYPNANCALAMGAFFVAAALAGRRELPWPARGLLLASAGVCLEVALLAQSRASLVAVPVAALLALAVTPGRIRLLLSFAVTGLAAFVARGPMLDVYPARYDDRTLDAALSGSLRSVTITAGVLAALGAAIALADRRLELSERTRRRAGLAVAAACVVATIAAAIAIVVAYGNPIDRVQHAWDDFTAVHGDESYLDAGDSRFSGGLGSNRWDFWRVAFDQFEQAPAQGAGADNFALDYLADRRSSEEPRYAHSLEMRILGGLGIVGALLFAGFVAASLLAAYRARRSPPLATALAATGVVAFGYWAIHGTVDWFWEFPGLAAPAFAWLGLAAGLARVPPATPEPSPAGEPPRRARVLRLGVAAALAAIGVGAAVSYALPWLAAREVDRAAATWRADAEGAFSRLDRARSLNPLGERADLIEGAIASRLGDWERMQAAFSRVAERNPGNWYPYLELAVVASQQGRFDDAAEQLARAQRLNPREPTIAFALEEVAAGHAIPPDTLRHLSLDRVEQITS
jgi:O-antigen ligase